MKFPIDKREIVCYNCIAIDGRLAQLGEHLPYKQRVIGSSPILSTKKEIDLICRVQSESSPILSTKEI